MDKITVKGVIWEKYNSVLSKIHAQKYTSPRSWRSGIISYVRKAVEYDLYEPIRSNKVFKR